MALHPRTAHRRIRRIAGGLIVALVLLGSCSSGGSDEVPSGSSGATSVTETASPHGGVELGFHDTAQVELVSPLGVHVMIDVADPTALVEPVTADDVLLTTHDHPDHVNAAFVESFPGQQLYRRTGELTVGDVTIHGIASVHTEGDEVLAEDGTDYVFVIDIGDLRIVHFGDTGQSSLTPDQLGAVGAVDVAITQFDNSQSDVDAANQKGFHLMEQVAPKLIIPTHQSEESVALMSRWTCHYTDRAMVTLSPALLTAETQVLFMGWLATAYGTSVGADLVDW